MRIPIRNRTKQPLTIFMEPLCHEFEVPVGGDAMVYLEDGRPHSIDVYEAQVTIWDEGVNATVEVVSKDEQSFDAAFMLVRVWLSRMGGQRDVDLINRAIANLEPVNGYVGARAQVFAAFHAAFLREDGGLPDVNSSATAPLDSDLAACYRVGTTAAQLNRVAREKRSFPELSGGPFDTDTARTAFGRAGKIVR